MDRRRGEFVSANRQSRVAAISGDLEASGGERPRRPEVVGKILLLAGEPETRAVIYNLAVCGGLRLPT